MKKILTGTLALIMVLVILSGCKNQTLLVPEYPLDADTIEEALEEWGLSCTMEEDAVARQKPQEQSIYSLYSAENGKLVAGVSSGQKDGERMIFIVFPPFYSDNAISEKEYENAIAFASLLFGGFESAHQVYDSFTREYDRVNTERVEYKDSGRSSNPMSEGESRWERIIGDTTCRIDLEQPTLKEPQEYLRVITFASDWDTFFQSKL